MPGRFVNLIMDVPALMDRQFTYELPGLVVLPKGAKVRVPFGRGEADGFVVGESPPPPGIAIKSVKAVYDLEFLPGPHLQRLAARLSDYYCAPLSAALSCLWPPVVPKRKPEEALPAPVGADLGTPQQRGEAILVSGDREYRWTQYLERLRQVRAQGRGAIFLVPEIKGVGEAFGRLEAALPGEVSCLHSELTGVTRRGAYLSLCRDEKTVALGTRAAIFAPVNRLGVIVVDDEAAESYKSPDLPFYDSRTVALLRSRIDGCDVMLGSSHPTVESVWRASSGDLRSRKQESTEFGPPSTLVNLRETRRGKDIMAPALICSLQETFAAGNRAILFLNRRGESTQVTCRDCGSTLTCKRCGVPLAYHAKELALVCHTCGRRQEAPETCPNCGGRSWRFAGFGIERAYSEFTRLFPGVPLFRMDKDAAKEESAVKVLAGFSAGAPACLLATRMVLGFTGIPRVGAVGVLSCDTLLNLPDYRAAEKVFHLLWSLRELVDPHLPSAAFVAQTYNPENHGVRGVLDPEAFYHTELENRRLLGYPPFKRFFKVHLHGRNPDRVREAAAAFAAAALEGAGDIDVLGPSPAPKPKVRLEYRWQVGLRGADASAMASLQRRAAASVGGGVKVSVDVDPVDMA